MAVTFGIDLQDEHCSDRYFKGCTGGSGSKRMVDQGKVERRTSVADRRRSLMDRRQFIDVGWPILKERRLASADRRKGPKDRRR